MFNKFAERNLAVIAVQKGSKAPVFEAAGYDKWEESGTPQNMLDLFESRYPLKNGYGIGVIMGRYSRMSSLDVDSMDQKLIEALPYSPLLRRGREGRYGALFFRYNPELRNCTIKGANGDVDVLIERKYIIVPPTIHMNTGRPYTWATPDASLESLNADDLPMLTQADLDRIAIAQGHNVEEKNHNKIELDGEWWAPIGENRCPHGSQDRLKSFASILIFKLTPIDEAVKMLIQYDQEHHIGLTYFQDKSRPDCKLDEYSNAFKFYTSIYNSHQTKRAREGLPPEIPMSFPKIEVKSADVIKKQESEKLVTPSLGGFHQRFVDLCDSMSDGDQKQIALSAAMALAGHALSNRVLGQIGGRDVHPAMLMMIIAKSGFGKETPQKIISNLSSVQQKMRSLPKSTISVIQNFAGIPDKGDRKGCPPTRELLYMIDEASVILRGMSSTKGGSEKDLSELFCTLYSKSLTLYRGESSMTHGQNHGECFNPAVTLWLATTPSAFVANTEIQIAESGLLPRFVLSIQDDIGEFKKPRSMVDAMPDIRNIDAEILSMQSKYPINLAADVVGSPFRLDVIPNNMKALGPVHPKIIRATDQAEILYDQLSRIHFKLKKSDTSAAESAFEARIMENTAKLLLQMTVMGGRDTMEAKDLALAYAVVKDQFEHVRPFLSQLDEKTPFGILQSKLIALVKANGIKGITRTEITHRIQRKRPHEYTEALDSLVECGILFTEGPRKPYYHRDFVTAETFDKQRPPGTA